MKGACLWQEGTQLLERNSKPVVLRAPKGGRLIGKYEKTVGFPSQVLMYIRKLGMKINSTILYEQSAHDILEKPSPVLGWRWSSCNWLLKLH
jgi:hypothetical protein